MGRIHFFSNVATLYIFLSHTYMRIAQLTFIELKTWMTTSISREAPKFKQFIYTKLIQINGVHDKLSSGCLLLEKSAVYLR